MPRIATNLPKDEQTIYDRVATNKAKMKVITDKGDKTTPQDQNNGANLKKSIAEDSAVLKRMQYKRNLGTSVEAFLTAARRLRARAGGHSEAQRDYVVGLVDEHAAAIMTAFRSATPPAKDSGVTIPD